VGCGLIMSTIFHILVREVPPERGVELNVKTLPDCNNNNIQGENHAFIDYSVEKKPTLDTPMDWLKSLPMYTNAIIYMSARLAANSLQIYLTLYISDTIKLPAQYIGILPFVQYFFGFLASFSTKYIHKAHSTAAAYFCGCILVFAASIMVRMVDRHHAAPSIPLEPTQNFTDQDWTQSTSQDEGWTTNELIPVFGIFALYGCGGNMVVCSALGLTAELIGDNTKSSAFVYGLMSFGEKIFNGVAVVILERLNTCDNEKRKNESLPRCTKPECEFYGRFVSWGTSGILMVGLIFVIIQRYVKH